MGWPSDWLYSLIFAEVEQVWQEARRLSQTGCHKLPDFLLISEWREADWEHAWCRGDRVRSWNWRDGSPELLSTEAEVQQGPGEIRGLFYDRGLIAFCLAGRSRVLFTYVLGPRYGRGLVFQVRGQGSRGMLTRVNGPGWVS